MYRSLTFCVVALLERLFCATAVLVLFFLAFWGEKDSCSEAL